MQRLKTENYSLKFKKNFFVVQDTEAFSTEDFELANYVELDIVEEAINATREKYGPFM